jgi:hypothetical protein
VAGTKKGFIVSSGIGGACKSSTDNFARRKHRNRYPDDGSQAHSGNRANFIQSIVQYVQSQKRESSKWLRLQEVPKATQPKVLGLSEFPNGFTNHFRLMQ